MPGFHHVSWSISAPGHVEGPRHTDDHEHDHSTLNSAGQRVVIGTVRNPYSRTTTSFGVAATLYDGRANVLDVKRSVLGASSLGPGKSTTFTATFAPSA